MPLLALGAAPSLTLKSLHTLAAMVMVAMASSGLRFAAVGEANEVSL